MASKVVFKFQYISELKVYELTVLEYGSDKELAYHHLLSIDELNKIIKEYR